MTDSLPNQTAPLSGDEAAHVRFVRELDELGPGVIDIQAWVRRHPRLRDDFLGLLRTYERLQSAGCNGEPMPERLGDFRILGRLARGGMGEVYLAEQEPLKRRVAVKVIRRGRVSEETRQRFLREQRLLAGLHQTHIVPIHTAGEQGDLQYFAMPYIEGVSLADVLKTACRSTTCNGVPGETVGSLAESTLQSTPAASKSQAGGGRKSPGSPGRPAYFRSVATLMARVAEAVEHAHEHHILHRDLKPANVMIDVHEHPWIIDFGVAAYGSQFEESSQLAPRVEDPLAKRVDDDDQRLTRTGSFPGTLFYMAPEQLDRQADGRTDVWGLGATLYELLTLRRAFEGNSSLVIRQIRSEPPPKPRAILAAIPPDLEAICLKALQKRPEERYASAGAFAEDLRRWLRNEPTTARPLSAPQRLWKWSRRNKGWAAAFLACTIAAALAVLGVLIAYKYEKDLAAEARARTQAIAGELRASQDAARQSERNNLLQKLQRLQMSERVSGWSERMWDVVADAAKLGRDLDLRNQAAATLVGLDARVEKQWTDFDAGSVAFSPDGKRLLIGGGGDDVARIWDGESENPRPSTHGGDGPVGFRPDGTPLQLVYLEGELVLWDVDGEAVFCVLERDFEKPGKLPRAVFTSNVSHVAAVIRQRDEAETNVLVWEVPSALPDARLGSSQRDARRVQPLLNISAEQWPTGIGLSPDGALLATGDADGRIQIRSLPDGRLLHTLRSGRNRINCFAFARDWLRRDPDESVPGTPGWLLAAGDAGAGIVVWDLATLVPRCVCPGSHYDVFALAFSPDSAVLASTGRAEIRLCDVGTGRTLLVIGKHGHGSIGRNLISGLAFSPDGDRLAAGSKALYGYLPGGDVWLLRNGPDVQSLFGLSAQAAQVALSPDERFVAALAQNWQVGIWDLETGRLRYVFDVPQGLHADNAALAFSPDGRHFAFSAGSKAKLWDLASGHELRTWRLPPGLLDSLAYRASNELFLFRVERQSGGAPDPAKPSLDSAIGRLRNLLGQNPIAPLAEFRGYSRAFKSRAARDGTFFIFEGIHDSVDGLQRTIKMIDPIVGSEIWSLPSTNREPWSLLTVDPAGSFVAVRIALENDVQPVLVDVLRRRIVRVLPRDPHGFHRADGRLQLAERAWTDGGLTLLSAETGEALVALGFGGSVTTDPVEFGRDGTRLFWGCADRTVRCAEIDTVRKRLGQLGLDW